MTKPSRNLSDISHIRAEIDRVDQEILSLIADRLELAGAVRQAKSGAKVWRPSREESLIRHLVETSVKTSPDLVSRIWAELMSASLALQGPMRLHVALEGDILDVWKLVRDRFGAALPIRSYPTASSALAAAYNEAEGVAILPSPRDMNRWWRALCPGGAMPDMHILAGLPRVRKDPWPRAVAVATTPIQPTEHDQSLIVIQDLKILSEIGIVGTILADAEPWYLVCTDRAIHEGSEIFKPFRDQDGDAKIIGCMARPLLAQY